MADDIENEMLNLRQELLEAEAECIKGEKTYSLDEVNELIENILNQIQLLNALIFMGAFFIV